MQPPAITINASVTHKNIDPNTLTYIGPSLMNWNNTSSLATAVQMMHDDFRKAPPVPKSIQAPVA